MESIKVSVITVCYNAQETILRTINSVKEQDYNNLEYIVVDGKSTDGTIAIIEKHLDWIDRYVSEPDDGLYYAMNKGVEMSSGQLVLMLNADDFLISKSTISEIVKVYENDPFQIGCFGVEKRDNKTIKVRFPRKIISKKSFYVMPIFHPSSFVDRNLFDKYGGFNTNYRLAADYDFFLRLYNEGVNIQTFSMVTTVFSQGGRSENDLRAWFEMRSIMLGYGVTDLTTTILFYYRLLRTKLSILKRKYAK